MQTEAQKEANRKYRSSPQGKAHIEAYRNRPENKEKQRHRQYKHLFGISLEQYNKMLLEQGGVCGICGISPAEEKLAVDHDHISGEIRGLLCRCCNTALGNVNDDIDILASMTSYLLQ